MIDGNEIKELREAANLTQRELAFAAGVSAEFISYVEANKKDASVSVLARIAGKLGVTVNDLLVKSEVV